MCVRSSMSTSFVSRNGGLFQDENTVHTRLYSSVHWILKSQKIKDNLIRYREPRRELRHLLC